MALMGAAKQDGQATVADTVPPCAHELTVTDHAPHRRHERPRVLISVSQVVAEEQGTSEAVVEVVEMRVAARAAFEVAARAAVEARRALSVGAA